MFSKEQRSFWLDSARVGKGLSRYSYMGDARGPNSYLLHYYLNERAVTRADKFGKSTKTLQPQETFFTCLSSIMQEAHTAKSQVHWDYSHDNRPTSESIPFVGGLVGFIGYEMKSESMGHTFQTTSAEHHPDSSFVFADRVIVFDHETERVYLAVTCTAETFSEQVEWLDFAHQKIREGKTSDVCHAPILPQQQTKMKLHHSQKEYMNNIYESLDQINRGETYEVCLTTQISAKLPSENTYQMYTHLRNRNPAPYSAFLNFNEITIASSSPERYLRLEQDGWITMKPIKGTLPTATFNNFSIDANELEQENKRRVQQLSTSEKDRAENLMVSYQ